MFDMREGKWLFVVEEITPSEDISICYGVVQKTKEQIVTSLPVNQYAASKTEECIPVTPGTVRKVLGKIEQQ